MRKRTSDRSSLFVRLSAIALAAALVLVVRSVASAHDFWIVPTAFNVRAGSDLEIRGQTGTSFPMSVSAVAAERISEARILGAKSDERLSDFSASGKSLLIRNRPTTAGQRVISVAIVPRISPQSGAGFERYLRLEGAATVADHFQKEGRLPKDSIKMRVTKTAKTIVEVGSGGSRAFARTVGHALEIVPEADVSGLRSGSSARFKVLYEGKPLVNATVVAGSAPFTAPWDAPATPPPGTGAAQPAVEHGHESRATTDVSGIATLSLAENGLWNLRVANAAPSAAGSGADWDVYFATLVFKVGTQTASAVVAPVHPPASDSSSIAKVVSGFHSALAAGDSLLALSYLNPDVTILESGGEERLSDYRSHHLSADIEFAKAVPSANGPIRVTSRGDVAWAVSTSTTTGTFKERAINSAGAELMVLTRSSGGEWKISAIHWSSRRRNP